MTPSSEKSRRFFFSFLVIIFILKTFFPGRPGSTRTLWEWNSWRQVPSTG